MSRHVRDPAVVRLDIAPFEAILPQFGLRTRGPDSRIASSEASHHLTGPPRLGASELARIEAHLRNRLTDDLYRNFELFLYVSKATHGPWAQRMYVFRKQAAPGDFALLYNWPVSTGRERVEYNSEGQRLPSYTPAGYYELDPARTYRHHVSLQWHRPMPYAMFFNWVNGGLESGLAIHGATGSEAELLGTRASAGCVRLAPESARTLFALIDTQYRGLAPRFAIDPRTDTMSNGGVLLRDASGRPEMAAGYKVLVFIENNGGVNEVAAIY
ncbi:MAG TPA: L,D-transpeptidase [Rhizomicrobium sp.]